MSRLTLRDIHADDDATAPRPAGRLAGQSVSSWAGWVTLSASLGEAAAEQSLDLPGQVGAEAPRFR